MAMTAMQLAQALDISVPQVEAALERLKVKGLITQTNPEYDQRKGTIDHASGLSSCAVVGTPAKTNN